ncbi:MAG: hypothetical protein IJ484_03435 [Oscillospiraceae bacterium]|nr:hypothetical protein [Oscillospiraceae bacterium]
MFLSILIDLLVSAALSALLVFSGQVLSGSDFLDGTTRTAALAITTLLLALVWVNFARSVFGAVRRRPGEAAPAPAAEPDAAPDEEDGLHAPVESDSFEGEEDLPLPPPEPLVLRAISVVPEQSGQPN